MDYVESEGEEDIDYDKLNAAQNRKHKKAGGWQTLGLDPPISKAITRMGFNQPTQIQKKTIPLVLDGRDVVGMSRTGSGKTAAFVVPMLQRLKKRDPRGIRALLLAPTRELAVQTFKLGKFTGLRCTCLVGGDDMDEQFSALHEHPDIIVATPGRLLHIAVEMNLKLNFVQYLVFDEADRLFEMGFAEQLHDILKRVPDSRQTLLFSATLPKMLVEFAKAGLSNPTLVRLDLDTKISEKLEMNFISCRSTDKLSALLFLSRWAIRIKKQTIIFCATMKNVEYVAAIFKAGNLDCSFLYSQLDPTARRQNIARFRDRKCFILIVTDVAARGVDIPLLDIAINLHFPSTAKLFVHRVGRVARAGRSGLSFSLIAQDELPYVVDLFLFLNKKLKFLEDTNDKQSQIQNTDEIYIGRFPESLTHMETDFLHSIKEVSIDITDLSHKSENAMKKYGRTRAQPSLESIRRVKNELRTITPRIHPFFDEFLDHKAIDEKALLQGISKWRPNAIQTSGKQQSASVMKSKRKHHQEFINEKRRKALKEAQKENVEEKGEENLLTSNENMDLGDDLVDSQEVIEAFDQVVTVSSFNTSIPLKTKKEQNQLKKMSNKERIAKEKAEHFISYLPSDSHRELGLSVKNNEDNFDKEARQATIDINADDDDGMYRDQKRRVWDRKRKKFVTADDPKAKKIRTEEGTWVPASYKSGRYENWQKQQKLGYQNDNISDNDEDEDNSRQKKDFVRYGKNKFAGKKGEKSVRSELKNSDQIMKERRHKSRIQDYQTHRRNENLKKRGGNQKRGGFGFKGKSDGSGFKGKSDGSGFKGKSGGSGFKGKSDGSGFKGKSGGSGFKGKSDGSGFKGKSGGSGFKGKNGGSGFNGKTTAGFNRTGGFKGKNNFGSGRRKK